VKRGTGAPPVDRGTEKTGGGFGVKKNTPGRAEISIFPHEMAPHWDLVFPRWKRRPARTVSRHGRGRPCHV